MAEIDIYINTVSIKAKQEHLDTPIPEPGRPTNTRFFTVITGACLFDPIPVGNERNFDFNIEIPMEHIQRVIDEPVGMGHFTTEFPFKGNWITVGFTAKWDRATKRIKCKMAMYRADGSIDPQGQGYSINYQLFIHHRR